jgi:hypothetical protein
MNLLLKLAMSAAGAATISMAIAATANAYDTIDYGTNQAACQAAEKQARATGVRYADCFETGPGHYSLALDD